MDISVKERIGVRCIVEEDGQKIYDEIRSPLGCGERVVLDFAGIEQFASPFLNFAIGQLLENISLEDFRRLLVIKNMSHAGAIVLERVIKNAADYRANRCYSSIVDDILEQQTKGSD